MLVRILSGIGAGQVVDLLPAIARARIAGGTAVAMEEQEVETASIDSGKRERENRKRKVTRSA